MKRLAITLVLGLSALTAGSTTATAAPVHLLRPQVGVELVPRIILAPLAHRVDQMFDQLLEAVMPRAAIEQVVRWHHGLRDLLHDTTEQLAALANGSGIVIPNLTPLVLDPVANTESSGFGWRNDPFRHRARFHSGTDFRGKRGTPILASGDGVVAFTGRLGGYGRMISIDHGGGLVTRYAHLQRITTEEGLVVTAGQPIGTLGSTGRATGPHLHFEVRLDGRPVDPGMAMLIARLEREEPALGQIAAFALSPELQSELSSNIDPPRQRRRSTRKAKQESRPERRGRAKRVKPLS